MSVRAVDEDGSEGEAKHQLAPEAKVERSCLVIVLAAGEGKRMLSNAPKVLARVAGLPMIGHAVKTARAAGADRIAVVIGPGHHDVAAAARSIFPQVLI